MGPTGEAELRAEEPESNDFVWPPPLSDGDIWWDADSCPTPPPALAEPTLEVTCAKVTPRVAAANGASVPIPDLMSGGVAFEWQHAVALVQQLGDQLKDNAPSQHLLDLDAIDLEATGRLRTKKMEPGTIPIVRSLGHVLHHLLTGHPGPANLRLIAMQASSETRTFPSVDDLMHTLARYERSDRLSELATLYERATDVPERARDVAPPVPVMPDDVDVHRETDRRVVAFPAQTLHEAVKWWRHVPRRTQILGVVAGMACITLMGVPLVIHESGQSTRAPQVAVVESPPSDRILPPADVTEPAMTEPEEKPSSPPPVSRSEGVINSLEKPQRPTLPRGGSRGAEIQPTSPRIPPIAEGEFERARELFDRQQYAAAADGFQRVITILSAGELSPSSSTLRWTATEMAAASRAALAPVPNQRVAVARNEAVIEPVPVKPSLPPHPAPDVSPDQNVYVAGDEGVIAPSPLKQYIPRQPAPGVQPSNLSVLELLIDSRGAVESVHLQNPKNRFRDAWWLAVAKAWQFRPASKDGQPVKFLERVLITTFTPTDPQ